ncbi:MAG TPA: alpha-amylase family glycosyl hydrolase [Anaerolineales bacterium]|nr:alpha-amylase family glycosyl hydrolase [Anaerolineales bacterium]HNA89074.1 alpha-amylase family glycosyl hydrolase [Anaerolineales bacterium]HNB35426.1 alpha-amylase family glycosyl hydrolase [Anaerolineales bacterium]HNC07519.1 alpha-amylase family glycosyl hydrolase [Anaerolineales bacterium]
MYKKAAILLTITALLLVGCVPASPSPEPESPPTATATAEAIPANWWKDAIFYEIFVRSFYDSDGDGIGDFNGIIAKLDYLNDGDPSTTTDLGITGIWLMPIFPSPSYHGYDVINYYDVNSQYGTMDDFKRLVDEAHKRGIKIVIDMVINHTSDQHPWFNDAKKNIDSPYRDWYIWDETDPGYSGPWNQDVWHPSLTGYYYGIFEAFMPDLNYRNPEVTAEMQKIYSFWLTEAGVDGFRLDAAKHLIEEGVIQQNTDATHEWYQQIYPAYKEIDPSAMTVGELFGDSMSVASRYVNQNEFDLIFNFQLADTIIKAAQTGRGKNVSRVIETSNAFLPEFEYAPFLTNHDQNRVMGQLQNDTNKAKIAAALMLTAPGTPFIYYGEEIGMTGSKPDENIRLPMQWTADENAGFSAGKPWRAPNPGYDTVNVSSLANDPASLLSFYRDLIHIRENHPAISTGEYFAVDCNHPAIYAALRMDENEVILTVINLDEEAVTEYTLSLEGSALADQTYSVEALYGAEQAQSLNVKRGGFENYIPVDTLSPYSTVILKFQP